MAKIMLVEDDNNLREIYGARLQAEGYEIVSAQDGEEALAIAVKEKPDLIISDVMMPRISGFDMLDILRNAPETKNTKVIMMTALSQAEDKSRADKLGADRYLVKSQVTLEDVTNVVHEVLGDAPSDDSASTNSPTVTDSTSAAASPEAAAPTETPTPAPVAQTQEPTPVEPPVPEPATPTPVTEPAPAPVTPPQPETPAATPAPTVEAIANPDIKVEGDSDKPEIQAPPAEVASPTLATSSAPPLTTATDDNTSTSTDQAAVTADATSVTTSAQDTPEPTAPTPEPKEVSPENIKVELPTPPTPTPEASTPPEPSTPTPVTEPAPAPVTPPIPAPTEEGTSSIGPNLAEALAAEEQQLGDSSKSADNASSSGPPAPAISNGAPTPTVITPTEPATKIPVTTPAETPEPSAPQTPKREVGGEKVIQPLNDPTNTPDLEALLAAEEQKAGIVNPTASSVISPGQPDSNSAATPQTPDQSTPPKSSSDLNNISI